MKQREPVADSFFKSCPACGKTRLVFRNNKEFICPDCGWNYFHNTAAAVGALIEVDDHLLFIRRGQEPQKGKLDVPGGFVDPMETLEEALIRECFEELQLVLTHDKIRYFCSFPNQYLYRGILYHTCDVFFIVSPGSLDLDIVIDKEEVAELVLVKKNEISSAPMAFASAEKALQAYLTKRAGT